MILREHPELQAELVRRLVETYRPKQIFLFGSQAWGIPGERSDVDIYVVLDQSSESPAGRIYHGMKAVQGLPLAIDLLVFTAAEAAERVGHPSTLEHMIWSKGKKLYEAA
jgi:predicted nucleotidyltransferase